MFSENNTKKLPKKKAKEKRETCSGSGVPQNRRKTSSVMVRGIFLCKKHVLYVLSTQKNWKLKNPYWLVLTNNCTSEKQNKAKEKSTSSVSLSPTQNVILQQRVHLISYLNNEWVLLTLAHCPWFFLEIKRRKRHTPTRCWSVHNWSPPGCVLDTFHIIAFHGSVHLYVPKLELVSIKINIF